jgi:hypothetical protein
MTRGTGYAFDILVERGSERVELKGRTISKMSNAYPVPLVIPPLGEEYTHTIISAA